jgi:hypothetical protein
METGFDTQYWNVSKLSIFSDSAKVLNSWKSAKLSTLEALKVYRHLGARKARKACEALTP